MQQEQGKLSMERGGETSTVFGQNLRVMQAALCNVQHATRVATGPPAVVHLLSQGK